MGKVGQAPGLDSNQQMGATFAPPQPPSHPRKERWETLPPLSEGFP